MSKILGPNTWKAINFYFDTRVIAKQPDAFTKVLDRLFGSTSKVLQKAIVETLLQKLGASEDEASAQDFRGILRLARIRFVGSKPIR
jgi:hypothetical protein